ncbi:enoyl-CoA hydratase [Oceanobacillus sp. CAU 1775]
MTQYVTLEKTDGIAVITIDNPPLNVLSRHVQIPLAEIIEEVKMDDEVICIVLKTAGEKAFVAGADIKEFPSLIGDENMRSKIMVMHELLHNIEQLPKPTIAVLDGLTFGGGGELALAFDIRIAEEHATLGFPEVKLGIFPGGGGTQRLPRLVGKAKAKEMMYTGEPITASEAEKIGLVNSVVPTGEGFNHAMKLASQIANKSIQSLARIKAAVDRGMGKDLTEGIELEATLFEEVFQTKDVREGVDAFINKREPVFTHK